MVLMGDGGIRLSFFGVSKGEVKLVWDTEKKPWLSCLLAPLRPRRPSLHRLDLPTQSPPPSPPPAHQAPVPLPVVQLEGSGWAEAAEKATRGQR